MSRLWPILACSLLVHLLAGAAPAAPTAEEPGPSCANACPCEAPTRATAEKSDGHHGAHGCPAGESDGPCPAGCDDCPCCPGGLVAIAHGVALLPPVHDIAGALCGPAERRAVGTCERLFIPPELASV